MVVKDIEVEMYAGNRKKMEFTIEDEDAGDGSPLDLTGFTFQWAATQLDPSGNYLVEPTIIEKTPTLVGPAIDGRVDVDLLGADTSNDIAGTYYWELEIVDGASESVVVATGTLVINLNVVNS